MTKPIEATKLIEATELAAAGQSGGSRKVVAVYLDASPADSLAAFAGEHIPGAVLADRLTFARDPEPGEGRNPLPRPEFLQERLRSLGLSPDDAVVLYDSKKNVFASRAAWVLRHAGFHDIAILNGGLGAWKAAGGAVEAGEPAAQPGGAVAAGGDIAWGTLPVLSADDAAAFPAQGVLLDARNAARFAGKPDPLDPRPGHVPGATNLPWESLLDEEGRFLPGAVLRERFEALGIGPDTKVGAYCGSGVSAAFLLVALDVAGYGAGALYPGSWSEWALDDDRPVAL